MRFLPASDNAYNAPLSLEPMIDMAFLIVMIVLAGTLSVGAGGEIPIMLPSVSEGETATHELRELVVNMDISGRVSVAGVLISREEWTNTITSALGRGVNALQIQADQNVSHTRVVEFLQECRANGISNVSFGVVVNSRGSK